MHRRRRVLAFIAAFIVSAAGGARLGGLPVIAQSAQSMKDELKALEDEERRLEQQAAQTRKNLKEQNAHKDTLDQQIANIVKQIDLLDGQLGALNSELSGKDGEIRRAEQEIAGREEWIEARRVDLEEKIRALSKKSGTNRAQMLLSTDSYARFLIKSKAVEVLSHKDERDIEALEANIRELNGQKDALQTQRKDAADRKQAVAALKKKTDGKKSELDNLYKEVRATIRSMETDKQVLEKNIRENQKMQAALDQRIAELNKAPSQAGDYKAASMYWPVPAVHTMSRGYGIDEGKLHKGLDISNHPTIKVYGQNIVAAADGVVLSAWTQDKVGGGYGYHVIVDHGHDKQGQRITTLYAHCSKVFVKTGQKVTGGQTVLALAGDTGRVDGPHLHFEVRVNNKAVDPIKNGYVKP